MTGTLRLNVTVISVGGRGVMIQGEPGSGKSALALALIDRGAILVGDDGVALETRDGAVWITPPERLTGKLEVRGIGLIDLPTASARLALILDLDPKASRAPESQPRKVLGIDIPCLPFRAGDTIQALRAELALARFGLG